MDWKFEKNMYPILDTRVECKVCKCRTGNAKDDHLNRTRLECKADKTCTILLQSFHLNRTRLECKVAVYQIA